LTMATVTSICTLAGIRRQVFFFFFHFFGSRRVLAAELPPLAPGRFVRYHSLGQCWRPLACHPDAKHGASLLWGCGASFFLGWWSIASGIQISVSCSSIPRAGMACGLRQGTARSENEARSIWNRNGLVSIPLVASRLRRARMPNLHPLSASARSLAQRQIFCRACGCQVRESRRSAKICPGCSHNAHYDLSRSKRLT